MNILQPHQGKGQNTDYESYTHKFCGRCKQTLPVDQFGKSKTITKRGWAYRTYCSNCNKKACQRYGATHKEQRNRYLREWRKKNPELAWLKDARARYKKEYHLSFQEVAELKRVQDQKCLICGARVALVVDHDHKTGKVRGMLCSSCNTFLGRVEANPSILETIKRYLEKGVQY